jgi:hypothetical protein
MPMAIPFDMAVRRILKRVKSVPIMMFFLLKIMMVATSMILPTLLLPSIVLPAQAFIPWDPDCAHDHPFWTKYLHNVLNTIETETPITQLDTNNDNLLFDIGTSRYVCSRIKAI